IALLANKGETAREILGKVQLAYQHLPKWLQQGVKEWNKGNMVLENNSRVIAAATSSDAIRGYSINMLFLDEAAFIENWDTFSTSVFPTISSGAESKIVLVSTPNGLNHFYELWINAENNTNGYVPVKVTWEEVPGRDAKWKEDTLKLMNFDMPKFEQEYCVEFQGSSGTLIAGWKLKELVASVTNVQPLRQHEGLVQYIEPVEGHIYVCVVDVSRGKGLDYSAFHIMDCTSMPYQQVCVFRSNMTTPVDYAEIIHGTCKGYNDAMVLVEINDIGEQVSHTLHSDLEYENVLFTESAGRAGKRITTGFGGAASVDKGIRTTKNVKAIGCSLLKLLLEQHQLVLRDHNAVSELTTFSKKGVSYEAEEGRHDDLVMGLVLFAWLADQQYFKDLTNINTLMSLRDKTDEEMMADLTPFGFVDDHHEDMEEKLELSRSWMWAEPGGDPY
ncbi:MAG: terminase large subunit domain-containing protein, partial [Candidatus Bathyarchaeia archaeon]